MTRRTYLEIICNCQSTEVGINTSLLMIRRFEKDKWKVDGYHRHFNKSARERKRSSGQWDRMYFQIYMTDPSHGASVSLTIAYFRKHCINSVFINYIGDEKVAADTHMEKFKIDKEPTIGHTTISTLIHRVIRKFIRKLINNGSLSIGGHTTNTTSSWKHWTSEE